MPRHFKVHELLSRDKLEELTSDLIDCFNFFWKEYWPDVNQRVFHTR